LTDPTHHPRPSLRRPFELLDGVWQFSLDVDHQWQGPAEVPFETEIVVPFAPETPASGIRADTVRRCWYRRSLDTGGVGADDRQVVAFGAVDRHATVWANGEIVATHTGGYTPFEADVTDAARRGDGIVDLVVRADDEPAALEAPRGKQDWRDDPHAVWYPRTSGIWRTVFAERTGTCHIASIDVAGDPAEMTMTVRSRIEGRPPAGLCAVLRVTGESSGRVFVDDRISLPGHELERTFAIGDGGLDDAWTLPWWPRMPHLFTVTMTLVDGNDRECDTAETTAALRTVSVTDNQICLNGRPYPLRLVLDQGYWPHTGATPPSLDAIRTDIELTRRLGFNGARIHQKTHDPRYFAVADRAGLLSWVEMPSAYRAGTTSTTNLLREWADIVAAHRGFPSVVAWVPVNESWGVPAVAVDQRQRALLRALTEITGALDGSRPVSANDGWETDGGDIVGIHDYTQDADRLVERYGTADAIAGLLRGVRPDGRAADLDHAPLGSRAAVLSEFGGVARRADTNGSKTSLGANGGAWGYDDVATPEQFVERYRALWAAVHESDTLAGACWTQLTDTYQEVNGLLTADRVPKADLESLADATRGR